MLPSRDVDTGGDGVLEPYEVRKRFGDDAGPPELNTPRGVRADELVPGRIYRLRKRLTRSPVQKSLVVRRVRVAHLQVHG